MTYEEAKAAVFAKGTVPNGYFGATERVEFAFDPRNGYTLVVCSVSHKGWHVASIPPAVNEAEALWLLKRHPSSRATRVVAVTR